MADYKSTAYMVLKVYSATTYRREYDGHFGVNANTEKVIYISVQIVRNGSLS